MSRGNALTFIKRGLVEQGLRDQLNTATGITEIFNLLEAEGLSFTPDEFEDAVNSSLIKCTQWEEADRLKEFRTWWEMLQQIAAPDPCKTPETCASTKNCSGGCCG